MWQLAVVQASNQTSISIGPQTWGASGAFAFNLWIQQRENDGDVFQYMMSTRSNADGTIIATTDDIYEPNEVLPSALLPCTISPQATGRASLNL